MASVDGDNVKEDKQADGIKNVIIDALNEEVTDKSEVDILTQNETKNESNDELVQNANNTVLVRVLSPQVEKNEEAKRTHKNILIGILGGFILLQFGLTFYIMNRTFGFIFTYYNENKEIDQHLVNLLFGFLTGYITSVVVELIYMLKFIVKNVFDTSISDLVKLFKEESKNK